MDRELIQHAEKYNNRHHKKKLWEKVIGILGCLVVFCTTYALILPAITMEEQVYCGIEEHQHDEQCFEKVLICSEVEAEPEHIHTEACYETVKTYICGIDTEDDPTHTHTDDCYIVTEALQCGMEEGQETEVSTHVHTDECYEEILICQLPEHTHGESCYAEAETDEEGQASSGEKVPVAETSEKETPSEEISGEEVSGEETSEEEAPSEEISGEEAPTEDVPDGEVSDEEEPAAIPDDARAFAELVPAAADSPVRAPSMTPAMLAEAGEADGEQAGEQTGSLDFKEWITGVEKEYWNGQSYVTLPDGYEISSEDMLRFNIKYTVPKGKLSKENDTIHYTLPAEIRPDEELTGTVYSSDGAEVGTYIIKTNGEISITFNDEYVTKNQSHDIDGSIAADAKLDEKLFYQGDRVDLDFNDKVKFGLTIEKKEEDHSDLKVTKSASELNEEDGTVSYTIEVTSENGTSNRVSLKDVMTDIGLYGKITVDGAGSDYTVTENADGSGFNIDLPAMAPGDKYTITYKGKLPVFPVIVDTTAKNAVDVISPKKDGNTLKGHDDVDTEVKQTYVDKEGKLNGDKITWTITVNPGGKNDVGGWTLSDTFNGGKLTDPVTITDSNEKIIAENVILPYTFPEVENGNYNTYTVTYETPADPELGEGGKAANETELTPPGDPDDPDPGASTGDKVDTGKGDYNPLHKTAEFNKDENGNIITKDENGQKTATIKWEVTIYADKGDIPAPWTFEDELHNDQRFTDDQMTQLKDELKDKLGKAGFGESEYAIESLGSKGYTIEFNKSLAKGQKITFIYYTTAYLGDGDHAVTFENKADINEKVWTYAKTQYNPSKLQIKKEDQNNGYTDSDKKTSTHGYYELANGWGGAPGVLSWLITITLPGDYNGGDLTMKEYLPEGLDLYYLEILADGVDNFGARKITEITTHRLEVWNSSGHNIYMVDVSKDQDEGGQFIKVVIPENLAEHENLKEIRFVVRGKIKDDFKWPKDENGEYVAPFHNKVEVESKEGGHHEWDEETQHIKDDYSKNTLKKVNTANGKYPDNQVPYSITVNPEGRDLLQGTNELHLIDALRYINYNNSSAWSASLVPGSVHVFKMNKDGSKGEEIKDLSYTYTEEEDKSQTNGIHYTRTLDIVIPDATPLIVEYRYKVFGKENEWHELNNEVSLAGYTTGGGESTDRVGFHVTKSSATANISGVTLYKMAAGNDGEALEGAVFELYQYYSDPKTPGRDKDGYVKVTISNDTTGSDGKLTLDQLHLNTAYKLKEVKAPEDYHLNDQPYYFWIVDDDKVSNQTEMPQNFENYADKCIPGQTVRYPNTPEKTSIKVDKQWFDKSGNPVKPDCESITFKLYQKKSLTGSTGSSGENTGNGISLSVGPYPGPGWDDKYTAEFSNLQAELRSLEPGTKVELIIEEKEHNKSYNNFIIIVDGVEYTTKNYDGKLNLESRDSVSGNECKEYYLPYEVKQGDRIKVYVQCDNQGQDKWTYKVDVKLNVISGGNQSGSSEDKDLGTYFIYAKDGWTTTITDLPRVGNENGQVVYYTYYVEEVTVQGYDTDYYNNKGISSGTITINNTRTDVPSYELPSTGGSGTLWYTIGGLSLIAGALMYELLRRKRGAAHN